MTESFASRFVGQGLEVFGCEDVKEQEKRGCPPHSPVTLDGLGTGYRALGHLAKRNRPLWCFTCWVVSILFHSIRGWGYRKVLDSGCIFPHICIFIACLSRYLYTHTCTNTDRGTNVYSVPLKPGQAAIQLFIQVNASELLCLLSHS